MRLWMLLYVSIPANFHNYTHFYILYSFYYYYTIICWGGLGEGARNINFAHSHTINIHMLI